MIVTFLPKKKYCEHLAAVEYYLKNNSEGKVLSDELSSHQETQQETKKNTSFGSVFWMVWLLMMTIPQNIV